jgi:hypothetical protein
MTCSETRDAWSTFNVTCDLDGELIGSISAIRYVGTTLILSVVQKYSAYTDAGTWRDELWLNEVVISRTTMQSFVEERLVIGDCIYVGGHYLQSISTHQGKRRYGRSYLMCREISRLQEVAQSS